MTKLAAFGLLLFVVAFLYIADRFFKDPEISLDNWKGPK